MIKNALRKAIPLLVVCILVLAAPTRASAATIGVNIYTDDTFSTLVGQFATSDIYFADWHPFGLNQFAASLWGVFNVSANADYSFAAYADDDSAFSIDGSLVMAGPGLIFGDRTLSQAPNPGGYVPSFNLLYRTDGSGPNNLALWLPCGGDYCVTYGDAPVPEPASLLLLGPPALALIARRRRQAA